MLIKIRQGNSGVLLRDEANNTLHLFSRDGAIWLVENHYVYNCYVTLARNGNKAMNWSDRAKKSMQIKKEDIDRLPFEVPQNNLPQVTASINKQNIQGVIFDRYTLYPVEFIVKIRNELKKLSGSEVYGSEYVSGNKTLYTNKEMEEYPELDWKSKKIHGKTLFWYADILTDRFTPDVAARMLGVHNIAYTDHDFGIPLLSADNSNELSKILNTQYNKLKGPGVILSKDTTINILAHELRYDIKHNRIGKIYYEYIEAGGYVFRISHDALVSMCQGMKFRASDKYVRKLTNKEISKEYTQQGYRFWYAN